MYIKVKGIKKNIHRIIDANYWDDYGWDIEFKDEKNRYCFWKQNYDGGVLNIDEIIDAAGYRERSVLENLRRASLRQDGEHDILRFESKDNYSCEYCLDLNRWTN